ncbi:MAG: hypothetical protein ACXWQQ_02590 [Pseudobdellovibrio sp.]
MRCFFLAIFILAGLHVWGSPQPLMGSSIINKPENSLAFSQFGFKVSGIPPGWVFNKSLENIGQNLELGLPQKTLLTFRLETVSNKTNLEQYVRHYLRDYNQYGFEVAALQSIKRNDVPSVIVDLNQKNKATRSRQMFFFKDDKMIVATCSDEKAKFDQTVQVCNQILSNFQWKF